MVPDPDQLDGSERFAGLDASALDVAYGLSRRTVEDRAGAARPPASVLARACRPARCADLADAVSDLGSGVR